MYEQTYIILDGEMLGNSVVINRYFNEIYDRSVIIIKDFIKIIDAVDCLYKPVRIKHFEIENKNCINISYKTKTSIGNVLISYILDKHGRLAMDGYLLQITSGENAGFQTFKKNFEINDVLTKKNECINKTNFTNQPGELFADKKLPMININNDVPILLEQHDNDLFLDNPVNIEDSQLCDGDLDIANEQKSSFITDSEESIELESVINNNISKPEKTIENNLSILSEQNKYNNNISEMSNNQITEKTKTPEHISPDSHEELEYSQKQDDFYNNDYNENTKMDETIRNDEKSKSFAKISYEKNENIKTTSKRQEGACKFADTSCANKFENFSEKDTSKDNIEYSPVEQTQFSKSFKDNLKKEENSSLKKNLSENDSSESAAPIVDKEITSDNGTIIEDEANIAEENMELLFKNISIFDNISSDIVDFFDTIPKFTISEFDNEMLNDSIDNTSNTDNLIDKQENAKKNFKKFKNASTVLDKNTKISIYQKNLTGYDKHLATKKIEQLKRSINFLQKDIDATSNDILDAQIELLTNDNNKAFKIMGSDDTKEVLQLDNDLFLSKDKIYRWSDTPVLYE